MGKKLERVFRDRPLTGGETCEDAEIRRKVREEFPPRIEDPAGSEVAANVLSSSQSDRLKLLAQALVDHWQDFYNKKGAGVGDRDTNAFMAELRDRARSALGDDFSERSICGANNRLTPDFYFPEEQTIVEVAMSLRNPLSEFERDVFKAVLAIDAGYPVRRLLFLSKPGAMSRCSQPGLQAIANWVKRVHGICVEVYEFTPVAEAILEPATDANL